MTIEEDIQAIQDGIDAGVITQSQAAKLFKALEKKAAEEEKRKQEQKGV